jgi:surfeit locus 1 family protein
MTLRRVPIIPTVLVLIAVGVMVRLGFWQIDRMHQKADLLTRYAAAEQLSADVAPSEFGGDRDAILYRHTEFACDHVSARSAIAGLSAKGASGIAHTVLCQADANGGTVPVTVTLGWSSNPAPPAWGGGQISGLVAPMGKTGIRVVADPPLSGLEANARPDPKDLPNNHWSYAIQWFLFAATALVIYGLALRKRLKG